jgi:hypothetical protein
MGKEDRRDIQIVGSVPLANADEVIRTVATILGERVSRITDGETGPRLNWIEWQAPVFDGHPMFDGSEHTASADDARRPWC